MRVLIIEDDEFKQRRIAEAVRNDDSLATILFEKSVNSGLRAITESTPDLVLLDMSLTTFDVGPGEAGGRPQNFGGIEVLQQMERLGLSAPVIVITQHERFLTEHRDVRLSTLADQIRSDHPEIFRGLVYYNSATGSWKRELRRFIRAVIPRGDRDGN